MAHDGSPVLLHDVVLMAYPLLSGSRREAEKIGRFGIGLKTLNQFGDRLEVHCPPLPGFEIHGGRIRQVTDAAAIPGFWDPGTRETLFLLRLRDSRFDLDFFRELGRGVGCVVTRISSRTCGASRWWISLRAARSSPRSSPSLAGPRSSSPFPRATEASA